MGYGYVLLLLILGALNFLEMGVSRAFEGVWSSGVTFAFHAILPVTYFELGWLMLKALTIRWCAIVFPALLATMVAGWLASKAFPLLRYNELMIYLLAGFKGLLFLLAVSPAIVGMRFGDNNSRRSRTWYEAFGIFVLVTCVVILGPCLAIAAWLSQNWLVTLGSAGFVWLASSALYWFCGWIYNRNHSDLIQVPRVN